MTRPWSCIWTWNLMNNPGWVRFLSSPRCLWYYSNEDPIRDVIRAIRTVCWVWLCLSSLCWRRWCNGVENVFLAHFVLINTYQSWIKYNSLFEYYCWWCASFWGYFQQNNALYHKAELSHLFHEWVQCSSLVFSVSFGNQRCYYHCAQCT